MELLDVVDENNQITGEVEDKDEQYAFTKRTAMSEVMDILRNIK